jgi:hypothetical protein
MGAIDYSKITSGIVQRGEEIFPFACFKEKLDWGAIAEELEKIPVPDDDFDKEKLLNSDNP